MINITDKNREEIMEEYIGNMVDSMDTKTLAQYAYDSLMESKDLLTNEALELEILDYSPHILEE